VKKRVKNFGPDALFSRRGSRTPYFRAYHPGLYRIRLTVTAPDGATGVDDVPMQVTSGPLVPIDTMAKPPEQDSWGVLVGQHFYPDPGNSQKWLQLVVLNPETLEPIPGPMANFQRSFENAPRFIQFPETTSQTRWISETDPPGIRTNTCG
jgi:hypothetical protein